MFYDPAKSEVIVLNNKNYDSQVTNNRAKGISIVQFYKPKDQEAIAVKP